VFVGLEPIAGPVELAAPIEFAEPSVLAASVASALAAEGDVLAAVVRPIPLELRPNQSSVAPIRTEGAMATGALVANVEAYKEAEGAGGGAEIGAPSRAAGAEENAGDDG